jgi:signal transduction histidine kinase
MASTIGMKILVVDPSREARAQLVNVMAELSGVVVQGAVASFAEAMRALGTCPLDAVVTGAALPDVEGLLATAQRLRLTSVVVLGDEDPRARARYLSAGASYVVTDRPGDLVSWLPPAGELGPFPLIGRLAAGVAHDINNYLSAATVSLQFAEHADMPPEAREELARARAAFASIAQLTNNLTLYARGGSPAPSTIDLAELVHSTLDTFHHVIPRDVQVTIDSEVGLPPVDGVRAELEQLVLNLVINACDAMPWGGKLWALVDHGGPGELRLEISDTGSGVIEEAATATGVTTPSGRSGARRAGLGLGVVRSVVARHHGTLRIGRRTTGGTSVVVVLPAMLA